MVVAVIVVDVYLGPYLDRSSVDFLKARAAARGVPLWLPVA
jgi:hypothetical protein